MYKIGKMFALAALFVVASAQASDKQTMVQRATSTVSAAASKVYGTCKDGVVASKKFAINTIWNLNFKEEDFQKLTAKKTAMLYVCRVALVAGTALLAYKFYATATAEQEDARAQYTIERA